jgi:ketosteroid isomerase-like protein
MIRTLAAFALAISGTAAMASPANDAVKAITTTLDKFNAGDVQAFIDAHAPGAIIIDEFAPYHWSGDGAVQQWLGDYAADSKAKKIANGRMLYGKAIQASASGDQAYVVLPTTYCLTQAGQRRAAVGTMTFVMTKASDSWKIASWTYSAPQPSAAHAARCGKAK